MESFPIFPCLSIGLKCFWSTMKIGDTFIDKYRDIEFEYWWFHISDRGGVVEEKTQGLLSSLLLGPQHPAVTAHLTDKLSTKNMIL